MQKSLKMILDDIDRDRSINEDMNEDAVQDMEKFLTELNRLLPAAIKDVKSGKWSGNSQNFNKALSMIRHVEDQSWMGDLFK